MTATRSLAAAIHDAVDDVTTAVEDVHRSVAEFPLDVLAAIAPPEGTLKEVRVAQAHSIGAVYDLIRKVNHRVRRLTTGALPR